MEVHRSRCGIGAFSTRPGRWYIWDGPQLLGYADRNRDMDGPNWYVFTHGAAGRKVGGALNLDVAAAMLLREPRSEQVVT